MDRSRQRFGHRLRLPSFLRRKRAGRPLRRGNSLRWAPILYRKRCFHVSCRSFLSVSQGLRSVQKSAAQFPWDNRADILATAEDAIANTRDEIIDGVTQWARHDCHERGRYLPDTTKAMKDIDKRVRAEQQDRKSTRLNSSHPSSSY